MNEIKLLDAVTVDQIAAGEVVERPASVVKELVENAIDAKATAITVEIKDGGITMIRITDDGIGIDAEQIPVAFCRHSTSKIRTITDLLSVTSLGFRGEALSSIASVSRVELLTKTADELVGSRYLIEGGKEISLTEAGLPDGTTFYVRNLFYNTPARRKFLKTPASEGTQIQEVMLRFALSNPQIAITYIQNQQTKFSTSGNGNRKEVIYELLGREFAKAILPIQYESDTFSVEGFIGTPEIGRGNRNFEYYFVNGRSIKSGILAKAIEDGYQGQLMQHRYPFVVLSFQVPGEEIDVNVHPTKMEVRFHKKEEIYKELSALIHETILRQQKVTAATFAQRSTASRSPYAKPIPPTDTSHVAEPFERVRREEIGHAREQTWAAPKQVVTAQTATEQKIEEMSAVAPEPKVAEPKAAEWKAAEPKTADSKAAECKAAELKTAESQKTEVQLEREHWETVDVMPGNVSDRKMTYQVPTDTMEQEQLSMADLGWMKKEEVHSLRMVGQVFGTYWIVEYDNQMLLIDQHAAHEKVLYEKMMEDLKQRTIYSQNISPPMIVSLSPVDALKLETYQEYLHQMGYEYAHFGGREYAVSAVPANLYGLEGKNLFLTLLEGLDEEIGRKKEENIYDRIATMSCKAAVKGNHRFSETEAKELFQQLLELKDPYHCPHGRPTMITMSKTELEKKFKRIL